MGRAQRAGAPCFGFVCGAGRWGVDEPADPERRLLHLPDAGRRLATGRVLLVQHREISDPDTGGSYTVKLYERVSPDAVLLTPETDVDGHESIEVNAPADDVRVIAELVEVLGVLP